MGRQHPRCDYFFIRGSQRQGGGDVCGQQSAKRGRKGRGCHEQGRRNCQKGGKGALGLSRKGRRGQPRAAGSPNWSDATWPAPLGEPALTSPSRRDVVRLRNLPPRTGHWGSPPPPPPPRGNERRGKSRGGLRAATAKAAAVLGHPSFRGL